MSGTKSQQRGRNHGIGKTESLLTLGAAMVGALITRELLKSGWRRTMDREPPKNPASSDVDWKDALLWGAISGALVGIARIISRRATSTAYRRLRE